MRILPKLGIGLAAFVLAACTPSADSPTRTTAAGTEVRITQAWTCLNGQCLQFLPTGNVYARNRTSIPVPRGMVSADGYISASNFATLLRMANAAPPFTQSPRGGF